VRDAGISACFRCFRLSTDNIDAAIHLTTDEDGPPEIQFKEGQRCIAWTCSLPRLLTTKQIYG
jgi:hypothetical protein